MAAPTIIENWREVLKSLAPHWDSYQGKPITQQAINTASSTAAVPSPDGGIVLSLYAGGSEVEIEIEPSGQIGSIWSRRV